MANRSISCVSTFFNFIDAINWVNEVIEEEVDDSNYVSKVEVAEMPGGSYRAGVIINDNQTDLFGAEEDA